MVTMPCGFGGRYRSQGSGQSMCGSKRDAVIGPEIHLLGPGAAPQPLGEGAATYKLYMKVMYPLPNRI